MRFKFFLLPTLSPFEAKYQFSGVILAEGLQQLGIPFCGNINYWYAKGAKETTIKASKEDAAIHVYDWFFIKYTPNSLSLIDKSKINVLLDSSDGYLTYALSPARHHFDVIFRTHYTNHLPYDANVHPMAFALSNRIIDAVNETRNQELKARAFTSYRVNMDLRKLTNDQLLPLISKKYGLVTFESAVPGPEIAEDDQSYWWQTGRRHDEEYFIELNKSRISLAFGGIFVPGPYPSNPIQKLRHLGNRAVLKAIPGLRQKGYLQYIVQYDSWRIWESFISNACPLFLNFEQCGFQWPINPIAGEHYIDVDIFNFKESAEKILALSDAELDKISNQGREWALQHYSPLPMAQRFLKIVEGIKK